uniref:Protein kinase domain-containing protein n=1 Tax=Leersia perrieri TaxID=77586 RepID=A0A0D9XV23_9ORYZ
MLGDAAATVAQLVGVDFGGIISTIMKAVMTAQQNKKECEQLGDRVFMIAQLLQQLQDPEVMRRPEVQQPLVGLGDTLREAHELVTSCQEKNAVYRLVMSGRLAERFREVDRRIDSFLLVFPMISHLEMTLRFDRLIRWLLPNDMTEPPPSAGSARSPQRVQFVLPDDIITLTSSSEGSSHSHSHQPGLYEEADFVHLESLIGDVIQEMLPPYGEEEFTFAELEAATNNFAPDKEIGKGGSSTVYMGRLADGREVAIKQFYRNWREYYKDQFQSEHEILSHIRHKHIIRLLGGCLEPEHHKHEIKRSQRLSRRKVVDTLKPLSGPLLVFEYMKNSSLDKHLHGPLWSSSPVVTSWSMRLEILLGVSQAIEYLHTHLQQPVIHHDIKTSNILLDESWVPRLSDFEYSVNWDKLVGCYDEVIVGTYGYLDPEYYTKSIAKPTMDVYSFGIVMLEVLTGFKPIFRQEKREGEDGGVLTSLTSYTLPIIEAGEVGKMLDKRPALEPTPRQLQAMELVAQTATCCVRLEGKDRPAISEVVAKLQAALELISGDE